MAIYAVLGALSTVNSAVSEVTSLFKPASRSLDYWANSIKPNNLNDPNIILTLFLRGKISDSILYNSMKMYGYDKKQVDYQLDATKRLLDMTEYIQLWRRKLLSDTQLEYYAKATAFSNSELQNLKNVTEYFPNVGDLIRFAVREVYHPPTIAKFGMLEDCPDKYLEEAKKAGVEREQALNFWAAHWELPSLNMGYAMLHRRIIVDEELDLLMKSQDVMPFWRDKLKKLSYRPLTRVDARRMYGFGVLGITELIDSYLDQGYSQKNAELMAEFTVKYEDNEFTGLTRSTLLNSYKRGIISEEDLRDYLANLNMGESVIEFYVTQAVYEKTVDDIDKRTNELKRTFLDGNITEEQIRITLVEEGASPTYVQQVLDDFKQAKLTNYKNPPFTVLERWLSKGVIDEDRFAKGMRRLGYDTETITNYMTEIMNPDAPIKRKFLKYETYVKWYTEEIIDQYSLENILTDMRMSRSDIEVIVSEANESIYNKGEV